MGKKASFAALKCISDDQDVNRSVIHISVYTHHVRISIPAQSALYVDTKVYINVNEEIRDKIAGMSEEERRKRNEKAFSQKCSKARF
jgi:DNA-directed RNA polymerase subunit E'/Rpb7